MFQPLQKAAQTPQHGLPCPTCSHLIQVTIPQILGGGSVFCTSCGLRLEIDEQKSAPAIQALERLTEALEQVEEEVAKAQAPGAAS